MGLKTHFVFLNHTSLNFKLQKERQKQHDDSGEEVVIALYLQIGREQVAVNLSSGVVMWFRFLTSCGPENLVQSGR